MSASGTADGGDKVPGEPGSGEPPVRKHGTHLVRCVSETGEKRVVVHQSEDGRWIDAAQDDVSDLSEMR